MKRTLTLALASIAFVASQAQNPIVQTCFSTDPAPMVAGDRLYVFTGHDEEKADFFWMNEWRCFSTSDMVNWTDHGAPLSQCDFAWADDRAWAPQCIGREQVNEKGEKVMKYYLYIPVHSRLSGGMAIGVGVADRPEGPYKDALGKPLYEDGKWDHIDPTVFIDDDDQAYIYWGNPKLYSAKLNRDMISFASEVKCDTDVKRYTEGPWIFKQRQATKEELKAMKAAKIKPKDAAWGKYFMVYAGGGIPECIAYSESDSPQGPWKYVGEVMPQDNNTKSFTNHSGTVVFKGHNYFFYHTGTLPGGGGFGRSVAVEEFKWNVDGRFPTIKMSDGVEPIGTLNPFKRVEAETIAFSNGIHTEWNKKKGDVFVCDVHNGDWLKVRNVSLADAGNRSSAKITVRAASALQGGRIEVRLDSVKGKVISTIDIKPTGGWEEWETFSAPVDVNAAVEAAGDKGILDNVYLVFRGLKGCKLFNFDWWKVSEN